MSANTLPQATLLKEARAALDVYREAHDRMVGLRFGPAPDAPEVGEAIGREAETMFEAIDAVRRAAPGGEDRSKFAAVVHHGGTYIALPEATLLDGRWVAENQDDGELIFIGNDRVAGLNSGL